MTLITAAELHQMRASEHRPVILDVRWRLDRPDGREAYRAGHIPGAVYVDMDAELSDQSEAPERGRHPLPRAEQLQDAAQQWGISAGDTVVVYDDIKNTSSARAWWLLRSAGLEDVRVLDGSLRAWTDAGYSLETGDLVPTPGDIALDFSGLEALTIDDVAAFSQDPESTEFGTLLDVRAQSRYTGEEEPYDPRAGHIPAAVNAPTTQNVDASGQFLPAEQLRERFLALGVDPERAVASYCGSGINAAHSTLALTLAGFDAVLYPGSFSEWSRAENKPVATGT